MITIFLLMTEKKILLLPENIVSSELHFGCFRQLVKLNSLSTASQGCSFPFLSSRRKITMAVMGRGSDLGSHLQAHAGPYGMSCPFVFGYRRASAAAIGHYLNGSICGHKPSQSGG
jgi:hypothetical protein